MLKDKFPSTGIPRKRGNLNYLKDIGYKYGLDIKTYGYINFWLGQANFLTFTLYIEIIHKAHFNSNGPTCN